MKKTFCLILISLFIASVSFPVTAFATTSDFYIDYDTEKVAMLGGKSFTLNLIGATSEVTWRVHNENLCDVSGNDQSVTVFPKSDGVAIISATCNGVTAYCQIKIIDVATNGNMQIETSAFNRAGENLIVSFSAQGYNEFYNFQGEWLVLNSKNEVVPFIDNGESVTVEKDNVLSGEYTVKLSSPGFSPVEKTVTVSEVDVDQILNKYLPILAIGVTVILLLLLIAKKVGTKLKSLYKTFNGLIKYYDKTQIKINKGVNKLVFNDKITKISLSLKYVTSDVQILNMDSFGYYQKLLDKLMKACSVLDASLFYKNYSEQFAKEYFVKFKEIYLDQIDISFKQFIALNKFEKKKSFSSIDQLNLDSQNKSNLFVKNYDSLDDILKAGKDDDGSDEE